MRNLLIVVSGPSGVGKGTIVKQLISRGNYSLSVSCTTRPPREGEKNGEEYFFVSEEEFLKEAEEGGFLEYSKHFGNFYGTPKKFVLKKLETSDVILEIDVDGGLNVKKSHPEAILIMIAPPDKEELRKRLSGRGTESFKEIESRLKRTEYELSKSALYDYIVVNKDLETCVSEIENIIKREKE